MNPSTCVVYSFSFLPPISSHRVIDIASSFEKKRLYGIERIEFIDILSIKPTCFVSCDSYKDAIQAMLEGNVDTAIIITQASLMRKTDNLMWFKQKTVNQLWKNHPDTTHQARKTDNNKTDLKRCLGYTANMTRSKHACIIRFHTNEPTKYKLI